MGTPIMNNQDFNSYANVKFYDKYTFFDDENSDAESESKNDDEMEVHD